MQKGVLSQMAAVITAAGHGKLHENHSKLLEKLGETSILQHVINTVKAAGFGRIVVVTNKVYGEIIRESLKKAGNMDVLFAHQPKRQGPANAVFCALPTLSELEIKHAGVFFADMPFHQTESIQKLAVQHMSCNRWLSYSSWLSDSTEPLLAKMYNYAYVDRTSGDGYLNAPPQVSIYGNTVPPVNMEVLSSVYMLDLTWFKESYHRIPAWKSKDQYDDEFHLPLLFNDPDIQKNYMNRLGQTWVKSPKEIIGVNTLDDLLLAKELQAQ